MALFLRPIHSAALPGVLLLSSILSHGCHDDTHAAPASVQVAPGDKTAVVIIKGKRFTLDIAADDATRVKGLGGRAEIPEDGGMIFCFPPSQVREMGFVMRDCPIDIDIIFLDGVGRALAMHEMKSEPPRGSKPNEGKPGEFDNAAYEGRLPRYHSHFPATFAVELRAGTIKKLGLKEGDKLELDAAGLKKLAK